MDTNDITADVETLNEIQLESINLSSLPSNHNNSDERLKMDSLLEKLRKGMIELSGQGDDFTKQMWNMYATFEDLISVSPKSDKAITATTTTTTTSAAAVTAANVPVPTTAASITKEMTNSDGHSDSVDLQSNTIPKVDINCVHKEDMSKVLSKCFKVSMKLDDKSGEKNHKMATENDKSNIEMCELSSNVRTNLLTRKMKQTKNGCNGGYQSDSGSSSSVANPLLDTISSLTSSDPYSDSDDCCDLNGKAYQQRQRRRCRRMMNERNMKRSPNHHHHHHHHHHSSSDADSIGYAGSNSIDSGYKSQCPTPEVPEGATIIHASDALVEQNVCADKCKSETNKAMSITANVKIATDTKKVTTSNTAEVKQTKEETKTGTVTSFNTSTMSSPKSRSPVKTKPASKGGLYSAKIANRLKSQNTNAHLEHLLHLRQTLISAIQKCENAKYSPPASRVASPIVITSSRSSSPASAALLRNTATASSVSQPSSLLCNNRLSSMNKSKCLSPEITKHNGLSPKTVRKHYHLPQSDLRSTVNNTSPTLSVTAAHNNNNNKSVRFDNDVQITSLYPLTLNARSSIKSRRKYETTSASSSTAAATAAAAAAEYADRSPFATKSILKDPLCANLRSQIETGELGSGCSLEGEIDSLLYGKVDGNYSGNYTMDAMQDIPYVTLIEDKYRLKQNSPSINKMKETTIPFSRALETTEHFDDLDLITTSEVNMNSTLSSKLRERAGYGSTVSDRSRKLSKTKFTEMAKYMLDILDDIQSNKKGDEQQMKSDITSNTGTGTGASISVNEKLITEKSGKVSLNSDTASETSYNTLPEYHIYEEVMYDCMDAIKHKQQHGIESRVQFNEPNKSLTKMCTDLHTPIDKMIPALKMSCTSPLSSSTAGSWGRRTYNRPKQRSNLYSLFTDSAQRRNISRSLEREWNYYRSNLIEDICKDNNEIVVGEYGFKASI